MKRIYNDIVHPTQKSKICMCVWGGDFLCFYVLYNLHSVGSFSSILNSAFVVSCAPPGLICEFGAFGVDQYLWGSSAPILNLRLGLSVRFDLLVAWFG